MSRKLTEDEHRLWQQETAFVKRERQTRKCTSPEASTLIEPVSPPPDSSPGGREASVVATPKYRHAEPSHTLLTAGDYAGVDAATVRRIRRGQMPIGARLDLHGMTQAEAHAALLAFIHRSVVSHKRLILVITGKGRGGESERSGVLKSALPQWLNTPELRPHILAFSEASPMHGGHGAFYILLRKSRL